MFPLSGAIFTKNKISSRLYLSEALSSLNPYQLLPLQLRLFRNLCSFTFKLFRSNRASLLLSRYLLAPRTRQLRTSSMRIFELPRFVSERYGKTSFLRTSSFLLNEFIFSNVKSPNTSFNHFNRLLDINLLNFYNKFNDFFFK